MTLGRDTTDESIIWNPGEDKGWSVSGELVNAPSNVPSPDEAAAEEAEAATDEGGVVTGDTPQTSGPEVSDETGMQPEGAETPSPEGELEENTNVETEVLEDAIDEAGPTPEASDIEVTGDSTPETGPEAPTSEPNPEPGNTDTAPMTDTIPSDQ